jgi:hypothetical protein
MLGLFLQKVRPVKSCYVPETAGMYLTAAAIGKGATIFEG